VSTNILYSIYLEYDGEYEEQHHVHDSEDNHFRSLDTEHEQVDGHQPDPEFDEECSDTLTEFRETRIWRCLYFFCRY